MAGFIPTNLTNKELFERVYASNGFYLENHRCCAYISSPGSSARHTCLDNRKGNNELGLFLDCLYRMGLKNPTIEETVGLVHVFITAKQRVLCGYVREGDDIPNVVKKLGFDKDNDASGTTFEQQCFIFTYLMKISYDKISIVQGKYGTLVVDKKLSLIEPE